MSQTHADSYSMRFGGVDLGETRFCSSLLDIQIEWNIILYQVFPENDDVI